jgi:hypothetical protein
MIDSKPTYNKDAEIPEDVSLLTTSEKEIETSSGSPTL